MDFVIGLPKTGLSHNVVWVVIDRFTKSAHFLAVKTTNFVSKLIGLYVQEIVRLHNILASVISDRDSCFTS